MGTINITLQGKGGVGKSYVASLLAQHISGRDVPLQCFDTDPVNRTFAGYKSFKAETVLLGERPDEVNPRYFDALIEKIIATPENGVVVIDNGASTFLPFLGYMVEADALNMLKEAGHEVRIHAVVMVTGLTIPVCRKFMLGDIKNDWLQDELDLDSIDSDEATVRGKDNSFCRVWRLQGISYDAKVDNEQITLMLTRSALVQELGKKGAVLRFFALKRQRENSYEANWPSPVLAEIGAAETAQFKDSYYVEWYITASSYHMSPLLEADQKINSMLKGYKPKLLQRPNKPELPCELTGFLNGLVCGEYRDDLPSQSSNLSGSLQGSDFACDKQTGVISTHTPEQKFHKIITVNLWPESVSGQLIGNILAIQGDIEICQICEPWTRTAAQGIFKRRLKGYENSFFGNDIGAAETEAILQLLEQDNLTLFTSQFQISLRASTIEKLNILIDKVCEILGDRRVTHRIQTKGAPTCWFNRLPTLGPRRKKIIPGSRLMAPLDLRDSDIAALWALPHSAAGLNKSQVGDAPVRQFPTPSGQSYGFQFQAINKDQALGNYLVFAPSGGGKSTLLMHLLGGLAKFQGVPSYIFDSKEGAKFMIEVMGGLYQSYDNLALNPLDVGDDTPANCR